MSRTRKVGSSDLGPLVDGRRVVILGGGPAGVGCALALRRMAVESGRKIEISIIENKEFAGESQYNQCVGVLSPPLRSLFEQYLGAPFPHHLSKGKIEGYVLHTAREILALPDTGEPSIPVRRVQFDGFMLRTAREQGIEVVQARASDVEFFDDHVVVYTDNKPVQGDVLVGAWGMDGGSVDFFARATAYRPPASLNTIVTKYHPGDGGMAQFGTYIHAFLPRDPRIEFGGITPKGDHLTINIAGRNVDEGLMDHFLSMAEVRNALPPQDSGEQNPADFRYFKGRFPCSLAKHFYGDRYVIIGDASGLLRAFKGKGVTSAILTGIRAAKVMFQQGISKSAFHEGYLSANQDIIRDFPYGQSMRFLTIFLARFNLLDPVIRAARHNADLRYALMGAVSAHDPYRLVMGKAIRPQPVLQIVKELVGHPARRKIETPSRGI